jgi:hypothetical protein
MEHGRRGHDFASLPSLPSREEILAHVETYGEWG